MTLKEYLEKCNGATVAIGTKGGNNYLYIGDPRDTDTIQKVFSKCKNRMETNLKDKQKKLIRMATSVPAGSEDYSELLQNVFCYCYELDRLKKKCQNYEEYVDGYKEVLSREVLKRWRRHDGAIGILVTGSESGEYWNQEEYKKRNTGKE